MEIEHHGRHHSTVSRFDNAVNQRSVVPRSRMSNRKSDPVVTGNTAVRSVRSYPEVPNAARPSVEAFRRVGKNLGGCCFPEVCLAWKSSPNASKWRCEGLDTPGTLADQWMGVCMTCRTNATRSVFPCGCRIFWWGIPTKFEVWTSGFYSVCNEKEAKKHDVCNESFPDGNFACHMRVES